MLTPAPALCRPGRDVSARLFMLRPSSHRDKDTTMLTDVLTGWTAETLGGLTLLAGAAAWG
ncbi:hypothetical protein ACWGNM_15750 [Streptomyces sp. NPDC055796]